MARGLFLTAGLLACTGPAPEPPPTTQTCDDTLTWTTVGQPFVNAWCTTCHGAGLQGASRFGAPEGLDYDTLQSVQLNAERIAARSVPDDGGMPPSGAAPSADRARFGAWLECGAPGEDVEVPAPCDGATAQGWTASTDGPPCPDVTAITGDLILDVDAELGWECLCSADTLRIQGATRVALPALIEGMAVDLSEAEGLVSLHLTDLRVLDSDLSAVALPELATLDLAELTDLGGLTLVDVPSLVDLGLHRLIAVDGNLEITDAGALSFLQPLDAVEQIGGDLILGNLGLVDPPLLRRLESVGGQVRFEGHDSATTFAGLDALHTIGGDLVIVDNPVLSLLLAPGGPTVVEGDLVVHGNPAIGAVTAAAFLTRLEVRGEIDVGP